MRRWRWLRIRWPERLTTADGTYVLPGGLVVRPFGPGVSVKDGVVLFDFTGGEEP